MLSTRPIDVTTHAFCFVTMELVRKHQHDHSGKIFSHDSSENDELQSLLDGEIWWLWITEARLLFSGEIEIATLTPDHFEGYLFAISVKKPSFSSS